MDPHLLQYAHIRVIDSHPLFPFSLLRFLPYVFPSLFFVHSEVWDMGENMGDSGQL